jgi:hypothetical protein
MAKKTTRAYKKVSCHNTKGAANKAAKAMRTAGKTARVATKNKDGKYCVSTAGKRKK